MFQAIALKSVGLALGLALAASPAAAQMRRQAPPPAPAPAVDPEEWWSNTEQRLEPRFDPLANRRWSNTDARVRAGFNNGVDASLYRLWGLQPLQGLSIRRGEAVFETWYRPTDSSRQAVVRVIVRQDGRAFVQARAGRGCCAPDITRRVDINEELTGDVRRAFVELKSHALWNQPRHVVVTEGGEALSGVCVNGASYDLTMVDDRRAVHLRRSCDPVEIGSVAPAAKLIVGAALGRDLRFDVVFAREKFDDYGQAYQELVAGGGSVAADTSAAGAAATTPTTVEAAAAADVEGTVQEIMAADRAFAARAAEAGAARAFLEFMDPTESLLVQPGREPLKGGEAIHRHFGGGAPEGGKLLWEPVEAWAAESGDFGASWGVSRWVPDSGQPASRHRYVTVWRRDAQGNWKALVDVGAPADPPSAATLPVQPPVQTTRPPVRR